MSTPQTSESISKAFTEAARYLTHQYKVGPLTMEQVFRPTRITNLSDLQSVLDAVEMALCLASPDHADAILSKLSAEDIRTSEKIARFVDKMERAVQADRDLVADILNEMGDHYMDSHQIRGGNGDHKAVVQIAIRHRLAAQAPAIEAKCIALPDHADILETIKNAAPDWKAKGYPTALAEVRDMANVGRASEAREGLTPRAALHADIRAIVDQALDKIETGA